MSSGGSGTGTGTEDFRRMTSRSGGGAGGGSSSSWSTTSGGSSGGSNSSSVENISTSSSIENGDQLTISFIPRNKSQGLSRCLSPLLEDVFSLIDDMGFSDVSRVSPVEKTFNGGGDVGGGSTSSSASPPMWYSDIDRAGSVQSLLKAVTNDDECASSSSSSYAQIIQHLAGDGILLKSLEKGGNVKSIF